MALWQMSYPKTCPEYYADMWDSWKLLFRTTIGYFSTRDLNQWAVRTCKNCSKVYLTRILRSEYLFLHCDGYIYPRSTNTKWLQKPVRTPWKCTTHPRWPRIFTLRKRMTSEEAFTDPLFVLLGGLCTAALAGIAWCVRNRCQRTDLECNSGCCTFRSTNKLHETIRELARDELRKSQASLSDSPDLEMATD